MPSFYSFSFMMFCVFFFPRKLQVSGSTDLASKGQGGSDSSNVKIKGEIDDSFQSDTMVRCLCGSSLETDLLIKVYYSVYFFYPHGL